MKARLAALFVLVILVGAVAWEWHTDETDARAHRLTTLDPDAIGRIDVALKGYPSQRFERRAGHWIDTSGTPADEGRADELAALATTPVNAWKPSADFDAAKIGLASPTAVLVLDGTRIEFGEMTALGKQRYVRVGDRIAFVAAQALPRAPRTRNLPL